MGKKYKVLFVESVFDDLSGIPSKIGNNILDQIELLEIFPQLGMKTNRKSFKGYQLIIDNYRILYKINKQKKYIKSHLIKHGRMDFQ